MTYAHALFAFVYLRTSPPDIAYEQMRVTYLLFFITLPNETREISGCLNE